MKLTRIFNLFSLFQGTKMVFAGKTTISSFLFSSLMLLLDRSQEGEGSQRSHCLPQVYVLGIKNCVRTLDP